MTPAKRALFTLAENLGCFVVDIQERMPLAEFGGWIKYYQDCNEPDENTTDEELIRSFNIAS